MKTHPAIARLGKAQAEGPVGVLEGFLEVEDDGLVRVHASLGGGLVWEVPRGAVVHHEEISGTGGKTKLVLSPDASVRTTFTARASSLQDGTYCGGSGTMYCWSRVRLPGGIYVIVMVPCGSCLPELEAMNEAVFARV